MTSVMLNAQRFPRAQTVGSLVSRVVRPGALESPLGRSSFYFEILMHCAGGWKLPVGSYIFILRCLYSMWLWGIEEKTLFHTQKLHYMNFIHFHVGHHVVRLSLMVMWCHSYKSSDTIFFNKYINYKTQCGTTKMIILTIIVLFTLHKE